MKRMFFLLLAVSGVTLFNCTSYDCCVPSVFVVTGDYEFDAVGACTNDPVTIPLGLTYTMIDGSSWLADPFTTLDPKAKPNYTGADRPGSITLKASNGDMITVPAVQKQAAPPGVDLDTADFDVMGLYIDPGNPLLKYMTFDIQVTSDFSWIATVKSVSNPAAGSVHLDPSPGTLKVEIDELEDLDDCIYVIEIEEHGTGNTIEITITQEGYNSFFEAAKLLLNEAMSQYADVVLGGFSMYGGDAAYVDNPAVGRPFGVWYTHGFWPPFFPNAVGILLLDPTDPSLPLYVSDYDKSVSLVGWSHSIPVLDLTNPDWMIFGVEGGFGLHPVFTCYDGYDGTDFTRIHYGLLFWNKGVDINFKATLRATTTSGIVLDYDVHYTLTPRTPD